MPDDAAQAHPNDVNRTQRIGVAGSFRVPVARFRFLTDIALVGLGVALIGGNL